MWGPPDCHQCFSFKCTVSPPLDVMFQHFVFVSLNNHHRGDRCLILRSSDPNSGLPGGGWCVWIQLHASSFPFLELPFPTMPMTPDLANAAAPVTPLFADETSCGICERSRFTGKKLHRRDTITTKGSSLCEPASSWTSPGIRGEAP